MSGTGDAEIDRQLRDAIRQMERLTEVEQQLAELRGEGYAADGLVRAEVGTGGHLVGLNLDPRALRLGSTALAEAIVEASEGATTQLADKARELIGPLGEGQIDVGEMLTGKLPSTPTATQLVDDVAAIDRAATPAEAIRMLRGMQKGG